MKLTIAFVAGLFAGALLLGAVTAQDVPQRGINHIGIQVENYAEAMRFYTEGLGLQVAYTVRNPDGSPLLSYLQLNRETFVELIPVAPGSVTGITHYGMEVGDIDSTVTQLRRFGSDLQNPGLTPAGARYTRVRDAANVDIEIMEFGPDALQFRAMQAWPDGLPVEP